MKSTFEKMAGTYTLGADGIYYPNLVSIDEESKEFDVSINTLLGEPRKLI